MNLLDHRRYPSQGQAPEIYATRLKKLHSLNGLMVSMRQIEPKILSSQYREVTRLAIQTKSATLIEFSENLPLTGQ